MKYTPKQKIYGQRCKRTVQTQQVKLLNQKDILQIQTLQKISVVQNDSQLFFCSVCACACKKNALAVLCLVREQKSVVRWIDMGSACK